TDNLIQKSQAQTIVSPTTSGFSDFSDLSSLTLNGSAASINRTPVQQNGQKVLRLTDNYFQSGSAFLSSAVLLVANGAAASFNTGAEDGNDGNHVGIDLNGDPTSLVRQAAPAPLNNGAVWYAWIDYQADTHLLEVRLSQTANRPDLPLVSATVDLPAQLGQNT